MYDIYRVHFEDDSSTVIYVHEDDEVRDAVVDLCEDNGWSTDEVIEIEHTGTLEEDAVG